MPVCYHGYWMSLQNCKDHFTHSCNDCHRFVPDRFWTCTLLQLGVILGPFNLIFWYEVDEHAPAFVWHLTFCYTDTNTWLSVLSLGKCPGKHWGFCPQSPKSRKTCKAFGNYTAGCFCKSHSGIKLFLMTVPSQRPLLGQSEKKWVTTWCKVQWIAQPALCNTEIHVDHLRSNASGFLPAVLLFLRPKVTFLDSDFGVWIFCGMKTQRRSRTRSQASENGRPALTKRSGLIRRFTKFS